MEPLFLAVVCACNAGLFREALREVYIPRIQRGDSCFTANVLGARSALLSVLTHFFEPGRLGSLVETDVEGQSLTAEDKLFVLMQTGLYLTATRGMAAPEIRICYERAESLCHFLDRPLLLYVALLGQWRYSVSTDTLTVAMEFAERVYSLTQKQKNPALIIGGYLALVVTRYFLGEFESGRQYTTRALQILRSTGVQTPAEEVDTPAISILSFEPLFQWHLGEILACHATMARAISLAKELNDMHGLAVVLYHAGWLAYFERNPTEAERCSSELIEVSTRQSFALWLAAGDVLRGWARSASGKTDEDISWIEDGIRDYRAIGTIVGLPLLLRIKAEALHLAHLTPEALEAIKEAEAVVARSGERMWCAELHRLRGVFLTALGAEEAQIEVSFQEAIKIAKEQKSVSLAKRAEATYAEYRPGQKASSSGGRGIRLPLW
jgi:hypothetical protein